MSNPCDKCSDCCTNVQFELFSEDHERWARLHDLKVVSNDGRKFVRFDVPCTKLKKGRCTIYEERPQMCKRFYCDKFFKGVK
jgi:Fe-S-cluster containining protein